ncbi:PREDICTED: uncharacterized protein LOC106746605, partial [Dinoponera quadriceps]|uniref:Uncharacterized protein LOC106746605 n=1 Tax=Dinoponera quadriceps TaxID=609295 RepID=A0A6P3XLJ7_DINQU
MYNETYVCRNQSCEVTPVGLRKSIKKLFDKNNVINDSTNDEAESDDAKSHKDYETSCDNSDNEDYIIDKDYDSSISYSPHERKGKKRKDITHDNTREDIKELKLNSSTESLDEIESLHNHTL